MTIQTVFGSTDPGSISIANDVLNLGFVFKVGVSGNLVGMRYYEGNFETNGLRRANVWTLGGSPLVNKYFPESVANGWNEVTFDSPLALSSETPYVAAVYFEASSDWSATFGDFTTDKVSGDITVYGYLNDPAGIGQGRFAGSGAYEFPADASGAHSSYGVDIMFEVPVVVDPPPSGDTVVGNLFMDKYLKGLI